MFIKRLNRHSNAKVKGKNKDIFCLTCKHRSRIIARRNSDWMTVLSMEIFRVKQHSPYAACSHCLNPLPSQFTICEVCDGPVEKGEKCHNCTNPV